MMSVMGLFILIPRTALITVASAVSQVTDTDWRTRRILAVGTRSQGEGIMGESSLQAQFLPQMHQQVRSASSPEGTGEGHKCWFLPQKNIEGM